ncbi:Patched domain-containing protein 3 RND-type protein RNDEu-3 [Collichthys lucidus]|uniref:Patched domain-containing protein 3 RND-type protein RNDEu-3 n=1 Tax=Collichthys lucidus TaxID=240159 RepID=A0A4U5VI42_COLLU|nr:Patched domain-containing protein 3 RND-type protein RNDEu-3 [Collichthys lucidus]
MGCRRTDCLSKPLSGLFEKLGSLVGSCPLYFFVIPLVLTAALSGGFAFLKDREDNDFERQYTPKKGPSKATREFVKENFPYNDSMFSEERLYDRGNFASLIAVSTNNLNVLADPAFEEILRLNKKILNITVYDGTLGFDDLCAKANGECVSNVILDIVRSNESSITYPVHTYRSSPVFLGSALGGVHAVNNSLISAKAVKLFYYLDHRESKANASRLWLRGFKKLLSEELDKEHIDSIADVATTLYLYLLHRFDNVRNKVWVAVFGVLSAGLAVLSSFGLLLYIGVPFVITVANSPFLILGEKKKKHPRLRYMFQIIAVHQVTCCICTYNVFFSGIGLNNMFVMVSDWQHTNVKEPVSKRMAHSYKDAVMPITITALTDLLKFSIGTTSDFPSVQSFCLYTTISIIFCYIYTVTFFGAFLALNGRREASNRHWFTCMKIPTDHLDDRSKIHNICCVGGSYDEDTGAEKKQPASNFFKDYYGPFLIKPWVKGVVIFLYVVYLAASIYGCFHIQQGIELYDLAADNSHVTRFNKKDREYFSDYGPSVMVIVSDEFPYWVRLTRLRLESCMSSLKRLPFVDEDIYTSWLDTYISYAKENNLNIEHKYLFIQHLAPFWDSFPYFKQDVNFTGDSFHASRFFIQTINIANASQEIDMLKGLKTTLEGCRVKSMLVYNWNFIFYDQYDVVVKNTIKNVIVITAAMLLVSLLLIPDPLCSFWVACSITSVTVGVTGLMALWNIQLDSIFMIIFTVCIGFTVDFSAHMSYAFASSKKSCPNDRAVDALASLGYPILQGAFSTILGVSVLATSEFHTFRMFFKIFFLVVMVRTSKEAAMLTVVAIIIKYSYNSLNGDPQSEHTNQLHSRKVLDNAAVLDTLTLHLYQVFLIIFYAAMAAAGFHVSSCLFTDINISSKHPWMHQLNVGCSRKSRRSSGSNFPSIPPMAAVHAG